MNLRQTWQQSILLRVASVLGAVALLAIVVVVTAAYITEQTTGKGAAINLAGSLRMQSYLLATRVADVRGDASVREQAVRGEVAAFERRLGDARLNAAIPRSGPLADARERIAAAWGALKSTALASAAAAESGAGTEPARARFLDEVHPFVAEVDAFVRALEEDLESRIHGLQVALASALFLIVVLIVTAFFVLDVQVFQPIKDLVRVTQAVRGGEFRVRAENTGTDELGKLGSDFNHMVEELGRLYGSLEAQIAAKTADLAAKNRSLSLLYETAHELSSLSLDRERLGRICAKVRDVLDAESVVICARHGGAARGWPLASVAGGQARLCDQSHCADCSGASSGGASSGARPDGAQEDCTRSIDTVDGPRRMICVPLTDGERSFGVMPLVLACGRELSPEQLEVAHTVGSHLGAALAAAEARDEHRRLALLEERSAIARELHDSLAQSLSFTKIQLARLSRLMAAPPGADNAAQAREVVEELREGVSSAYRQLRELLTTFRLQLTGQGLGAALAQAAADFTARCGVPVALNDELLGVELSANEQIHVLQIVREALANVEHHARAKQTSVVLHRSERNVNAIEVHIEDDGVGIDTTASPRHHFGLSIMRDRTQLLRGTLDVGRRTPGRGTRVCLSFTPQALFAGPVPRAREVAFATPAAAPAEPVLETGE